MKNRYQMTVEDNIFFARRIIVDSIYQQANLEGIAVTFAQTQDILNNLDKKIDLIFLEEIHELIARFDVSYQYLGKWRSNEVIISGTRWRPELPKPENILNHISQIYECENVTERAIKMGLWIMRCQPFKDGNKRVGSFVINKILIENGVGIFNVPVKLDGTLKQMLVDYYESNDSDELSEWIWKYCLDGINEV